MGKGGGGRGFPGPFRFRFPAFPRTFLERKSISFGSTHRTKHSRYIRREKGEEDVSRVVSSPVHTDNWVVRESFIVQGARLFIPFHSISLHRIPSFDRKRRENDGSQMPPTFFLLFYSHIFIYFLLVYFFFFVSIWSIVAILVEDATRWSEQSGNADLGRHMQQPSHARLSSYIYSVTFFFVRSFFFSSHFIRKFLLFGGIQPVSDPTSNIASLCVF